MPSVFVVIPNYNGACLLPTCLASVQAGSAVSLHTVVVDDGSTDRSLRVVQACAPEATIIALPENREFAAAANAGLEYALQQGAEYVFMLNNDVQLAAGCLDRLVRFLDDNRHVQACQPLLIDKDQNDCVQSAGIRCSLSGRGWDEGMGLPVDRLVLPLVSMQNCFEYDRAFPVFGCTGGAVLLRAEALVSLLEHGEIFDSSLGMFYEDMDLAFRLHQRFEESIDQQQSPCWCVSMAMATHAGGATVRKRGEDWKLFRTERNSMLMVWRYFPPFWKELGICVALVTNARVAFGQLLRGHVKNAAVVLCAAMFGSRLGMQERGTPVSPDFFRAWIAMTCMPPKKMSSVRKQGRWAFATRFSQYMRHLTATLLSGLR